MGYRARFSTSAMICIAAGLMLAVAHQVSLATTNDSSICKRELLNANKSIAAWAQTMEEMVNESNLSPSIRETVHREANNILDLIEDFGEKVLRLPAADLARDLVTIRRRANRLALDIYLRTFDMRWPQNSLQLGVIVERVQQACLSPNVIQKLESPPSPLEPLTLS